MPAVGSVNWLGLSKATPARFALPRSRADRSAHLALAAFVVVLAVALPLLVALGRYRWFTHDEWDFLAGRDGGDLGDLLIPHNEHWSTLPILVWRALFRVVGLRSYLPYQAVLVVLHLTAAVLLRVVMRRAGVGPWIATVAASLLVLFGTGHEDALYAANIGFVAALVFGLTHLLLADHDGPVVRRDWLGLVAGLAGLMCSGLAVTMVIVVGVTTLARRGLRVALLHTAPLGLLYAVWLMMIRDKKTEHGVGYTEHEIGNFVQVARFVRTGASAAFYELGQLPGVGVALVILLLVGLALGWRSVDRIDRRRQMAAPIALLIGSVLLLVISGLGRAADFGPEFATRSRYLHVFVALALPAVAVAASAVARRWRVLAPVVVVLLLVGVPGNVDAFVDQRNANAEFQRRYRRLMLTIPRVAAASEVPRSVRPEFQLAKPVTLGWLLDGAASGRVPRTSLNTRWEANATLVLALHQVPGRRQALSSSTCLNLDAPVEQHLEEGQWIDIHGGTVQVVYLATDSVESDPMEVDPHEGQRLVARWGPLILRFEPDEKGELALGQALRTSGRTRPRDPGERTVVCAGRRNETSPR